jgi:hypothetical protein
METIGIQGSWLGSGEAVSAAAGDGVSPAGVAVGSGAARRQTGRLRFGVGVGDGDATAGFGVCFGGGGAVGIGTGGTRGSGKPGSLAAEMTCVRRQFGPYGAVLAFGAGVTETGATLSRRFSVA